MSETNIGWCAGDDGTPGKTWNPTRGCSRVSPGCGGAAGMGGCYAEKMAYRFSGKGRPYEGLVRLTKQGPRWTGKVRLVEEMLDLPFRWRRPTRIFVDSMSDLFHAKLADAEIDRVFAVMLLAPQHTFMTLTKRPDRMLGYLTAPDLYDRVLVAASEFRRVRPSLMNVPISNPTNFPARWIWWGTSVENQACADARLPALLRVPAAVRFVSAEPLLGPVDLSAFLPPRGPAVAGRPDQALLSWIIAGGESGPGARPCDKSWLTSLRDQCVAAQVPYFLKQLGGYPNKRGHDEAVLDGRRWTQFPEAR
jgi:protein gp37